MTNSPEKVVRGNVERLGMSLIRVIRVPSFQLYLWELGDGLMGVHLLSRWLVFRVSQLDMNYLDLRVYLHRIGLVGVQRVVLLLSALRGD